jgi:hypothetical protein
MFSLNFYFFTLQAVTLLIYEKMTLVADPDRFGPAGGGSDRQIHLLYITYLFEKTKKFS